MNRVLLSCLFDCLSVGEATSLMAYKACVDEDKLILSYPWIALLAFPKHVFPGT